MPTYEYQAQRADGQVVQGVVIGVSLDVAAGDLTSRGFQVLKIGIASSPFDPLSQATPAPAARPASQAQRELPRTQVSSSLAADLDLLQSSPPLESVSPQQLFASPPTEQRSYFQTSVYGPLAGKVPISQIAFFFRQFGTMIHAGVPMVQSMHTLAGQSGSQKLTSVIHELAGHVEAGRPVSAGLQRYPEIFSSVIVSLVRAGEEGGFLDDALTMTADYLDQDIRIRNLYKKATFVPKLELAASIVIIVAANSILKMVGGHDMLWSPLTTPSTWIWLAPLVVAIFLFVRIGLANGTLKHQWDMISSNLPYVGKTLRQFAMAKFGRAFAAMHKAGVPMTTSIKHAADACGNEHLRALMYPAVRRLESGAAIGDTLAATQAFSPIVLDMIRTGEITGNLDQMLTKMSDFYEGDAEVRSIQMGHVVGVVLFLCVAIYIAIILISFWTSYGSGVMSHGSG